MGDRDICNFVFCSYDEAHNIEIQFHETIQKFAFPTIVLCLYKSLPEELEDRYLMCHDLIIKHAITSTVLGYVYSTELFKVTT